MHWLLLGSSVLALTCGMLQTGYARERGGHERELHEQEVHGRGLLFLRWCVVSIGRAWRYVVEAPQIGITAPALPPNNTTVMVRGVPYYYANHTYYLQSPSGYLVVDPLATDGVAELPPTTSTAHRLAKFSDRTR